MCVCVCVPANVREIMRAYVCLSRCVFVCRNVGDCAISVCVRHLSTQVTSRLLAGTPTRTTPTRCSWTAGCTCLCLMVTSSCSALFTSCWPETSHTARTVWRCTRGARTSRCGHSAPRQRVIRHRKCWTCRMCTCTSAVASLRGRRKELVTSDFSFLFTRCLVCRLALLWIWKRTSGGVYVPCIYSRATWEFQ